jgi:hypothetical protein
MRSTSPSPRSRAIRIGVTSFENSRLSTSVVTPIERVEAPPALVALQNVRRADVEPEAVGVDDRLGERRHILEAEIEALAGDRMDAVRRIAGQREAVGDEGAGQRQAEREGAARADRPDRAELVAEAAFQFLLEDEVVGRDQPLGIGRPLGPDQGGPVAGQRQDREGAGGQEMLLRHALMRPFVLDRGDDARLAVVPMHGLDAGNVAQLRFRAVAGDQQPRLDGLSGRECRRGASPVGGRNP